MHMNKHEYSVNVFLFYVHIYVFFLGPVIKLAKLEKQQQRKEKTRPKDNSESGMDKGVLFKSGPQCQ